MLFRALQQKPPPLITCFRRRLARTDGRRSLLPPAVRPDSRWPRAPRRDCSRAPARDSLQRHNAHSLLERSVNIVRSLLEQLLIDPEHPPSQGSASPTTTGTSSNATSLISSSAPSMPTKPSQRASSTKASSTKRSTRTSSAPPFTRRPLARGAFECTISRFPSPT